MTKAPYILVSTQHQFDLISSMCRAANLPVFDDLIINPNVFYMFADNGESMMSGFPTMSYFATYCVEHNRPYIPVNSFPHYIACARAYYARLQAVRAEMERQIAPA